MSIEVVNLSKHYAAQKALDNISFKTQSNHIIAFLGPNGAGKSTTMKVLAGVLVPNDGKAFVCGVDVKLNPIVAKRKIGYLPENNPLYQDMYVKEILLFEADIHKINNKQKRVLEVMEMTGLIAEQHKKVSQLSKGYKQRVGLAMAIIHDPEVLILDEPTSGLDPNQIIEIRGLIKSLSSNKTVLLSTHIMQEVDAMCDEVIILHQGKIKDHYLKDEQTLLYGTLTTEEIFVKMTN